MKPLIYRWSSQYDMQCPVGLFANMINSLLPYIVKQYYTSMLMETMCKWGHNPVPVELFHLHTHVCIEGFSSVIIMELSMLTEQWGQVMPVGQLTSLPLTPCTMHRCQSSLLSDSGIYTYTCVHCTLSRVLIIFTNNDPHANGSHVQMWSSLLSDSGIHMCALYSFRGAYNIY